jgi:cysteine desulfurase
MKKIGLWRARLEAAVLAEIPEVGLNGANAPRVSNTSNIYFDHVGGDSLVLALDERGIAVSRGAACTSGEAEPSSILMAMGRSGERSRSSLRFSIGKTNSEKDIDDLISVLPGIVANLRAESPFYSALQGVVTHER